LKIYLAGPLFTTAERDFNAALAALLRDRGHEVFLPQEHEQRDVTARAIFDILEVPVWGREKDAADRLAALIMTQFGEDVSRTTIVGTASLFMWSDKAWTGSDFSDTGSPDYQRFYNYVCIAFAAAPLQFGDLVDKGILPKRRAARCQDEYEQVRKAFDLRIMPYVDANLLIKARATPWLTWAPAK